MGENKIVLIVDDMEINRMILAEYLKDDYNIMEASNGEEALDVIRKNKEDIKVIFLDRIMPKMNGFQLMEILSEEGLLEKIPVILITGDYSMEEGERGCELGISDIITKPFEPFLIRKRVENIIELYQYRNALG